MKKLYRHGEIIFEATKELPENLKETKTNLLMKGSGNNPHTFKGGKLYLKNVDDYIFGYFEAKNTELFHPEHGEKKRGNLLVAELPDGNYILRRQVEYTPEGLKPVID